MGSRLCALRTAVKVTWRLRRKTASRRLPPSGAHAGVFDIFRWADADHWRARVGILLHQVPKCLTTEVGLLAVALTSSKRRRIPQHRTSGPCSATDMEPNSTVAAKKKNGTARQAIA